MDGVATNTKIFVLFRPKEHRGVELETHKYVVASALILAQFLGIAVSDSMKHAPFWQRRGRKLCAHGEPKNYKSHFIYQKLASGHKNKTA